MVHHCFNPNNRSEGEPVKAPSRKTLSFPENGDEQYERVFGFTPKPEQRKVAEHIDRGENCILVAGSGWGTTLAYLLPLALWSDRIILIVSSLVEQLEEHDRVLWCQPRVRNQVLLMSKLNAGAIRILLSAEEAVMVRDVSDILRVIQFRFLKNISILAKRLALQFATQVFKALAF
ncbi:hypothetical protein KVV02_004627 [Mortierella alpina]|uniref:Helicase ATP-binding domain-containing protein n=1 Tax=Mortierella alpina TaxID=64518 RepID=A0A9P8A482_MORAP|nr:hypothetical protein KVV02_004627 [Mortierella alpina]